MTITLIQHGQNRQQIRENPRPIVAGFAAVFNVLSKPRRDPRTGEIFRIRFLPGCFSASLKQDHDVCVCVDHNELRAISVMHHGNVFLQETPQGLWFEADPENTFWGSQAVRYLQIGELEKASVSFVHGECHRVRENGELIEEHISARRLMDVAICNTPAFPQTRVELIETCSLSVQNRRLKLLKSSLLMDN